VNRTKQVVIAVVIIVVGVLIVYFAFRPATSGHGSASSVQLRIASWGGDLQDALNREEIQPAARMIGVSARVETYSGEYDRLAATIRNDTNMFDIVHVESIFVKQGAAEKLTLPIDWTIVDRKALVESATDTNGIGALSWALVLAWNTDRLPKNAAPPKTWTDFFDLQKYPGPRCVRKTPESNLEMALLADGVSPDRIYQPTLDVQRALKRLDAIKSSITWWSSGAELEQKLTAGCSLAAAWNGRVLNLKKSDNQPVDFTYEQAINQYDWWVIPANTKHTKEAMRFLAALSEGVGQDAIATRFGYGPVSKKALREMSPDVRSTIPTDPINLSRGIVFDTDWWMHNQKTALAEWNKWLLQQ
jgi:putative spermidine/putrescine transport system substrate-binding protein